MSLLRVPFRAIFNSARAASVSHVGAASTIQISRRQEWLQPRFYSASAGLSKADIETRVMDVLKSFEKVDPAKLTAKSSFTEDLGLDSLDAVEVVMAVEEEFTIEIPDEEADEITTVQQAIDYISKTPEAR